MYIPPLYRVDDLSTLQTFMKKHNFATLVSFDGDRFQSTEMPFLLKSGGPYGVLAGHMARANAQSSFTGREVMVLFHGPHAYISPNWYHNRETAVPTWNHATVCAYGIPKIIHEPDAVLETLRGLVHQHEKNFERPWTMGDAEAYVNRLLSALVAFEIPVDRLEGQFKLSQDRPADFPGIIGALEKSNDSLGHAIAAMMQTIEKGVENVENR